MRSALRTSLLLVAALGLPAAARASFDEFSDQRARPHFELKSEELTLALKGELQLALHDLEGEGGPEHDSPTDTRTLGTRSPHVELDAFWLALRLGLAPGLQVNSALEIDTRRARLGSVWLDYQTRAPERLRHHLQLGYQTPIVAVDRLTARYPLVATAFWRQPELHLAYEARLDLGEALYLEAGASVAMMRPLDFTGVQQSPASTGTINLLGYGPAATFSGNAPVVGGRLKVSLHGAFAEIFGFRGELAAQGGTDVLRSGFQAYRNLPGYSSADATSGAAWWSGGRVGFAGRHLHLLAEAIASREDLLRRAGAWAQLSWRFELPGAGRWLPAVEPLARAELYRILDSTVPSEGRALRSPSVGNAVSWDWDVATAALLVELYRDLIWLRAEYYFIREANGVPALGIADEPFTNDELLVQIALRF